MSASVIRLGRERWPTLTAGADLEWLETNGLGGFAFGTVAGANTRFYHGLLAAALDPPVGRSMLCAKLEPVLTADDGKIYRLYSNFWASGFRETGGVEHLESFALDPFPTWTFRFDGYTVEQRLFMVHGRNLTVVRYKVKGPKGRKLLWHLTPLCTSRSIHDVIRESSNWAWYSQQEGPAAVRVEGYNLAPGLYMAADAGAWRPDGRWIRALRYPAEAQRGEATEEDLYAPGDFLWQSDGSGELTVALTTEQLSGQVAGAAWEAAERERRTALRRRATAGHPDPAGVVGRLALAADQFIVSRRSTGTATVIAGYPWFTDWGRDTMIALPGLALATGRPQVAAELLQTFARYVRDGLVPNTFPEEEVGEPLYNTADASLWFFQSVWEYLRTTGDKGLVRSLGPVLSDILQHHVRGTHFHIYMAADGLLHCGSPDVQVTWMDAKVGDWVVTPRSGYPVEIQALWYAALRIMAELAGDGLVPGDPDRYASTAALTRRSFEARFWHAAGGHLCDLLHDDGTPDPTLRPNQLLALSLAHPLLEGERARAVVDACRRHLVTPYGLRSLAPTDPAYTGLYYGDRRTRDGAYHQGTVWSWLIGPYVSAYLAAYGDDAATRAASRRLLAPLLAHLDEQCLNSVAEIFDGDPPYFPRGCVAQAWGVAELLRAWQRVQG